MNSEQLYELSTVIYAFVIGVQAGIVGMLFYYMNKEDK